jgi:hypothetical protein
VQPASFLASRRRTPRWSLDQIVWVCLCIVLVPQLVPAFGEFLSTYRILPLLGLMGLVGSLVLPRPRQLLDDCFVYWPVLFLAVATFTTLLNDLFYGHSWDGATGYMYLIASGVSMYCMTVATVTTRRRFISLSVLLIVGALITAGSLVWANYTQGVSTSSSSHFEVQGGLLDNQNWLAPYILGGLSVSFCLLELYRRTWRRKGLILSIVGLYFASFFTGSRGTVLAATLLIGLLFFGTKSKQRALRFLALASMLALLWLIRDLPIVSYTFERLNKSDYEEVSSEKRYWLITNAIDLWSENVLIGVGLGAVWAKTGGAAHMAFTGLLAETGVLGLTLFYLPAFILLAKGLWLSRSTSPKTKEQQKLLRILSIGLLAFLFHGLFNETYFIKNYYIHLGLLWSIMHARWLTNDIPLRARTSRGLILHESVRA